MNTASANRHNLTTAHEITVKFTIVAKNDVDDVKVIDKLGDWIDGIMAYSIGQDYISDNGYPYIFDYELEG